MPTPPRGAGLRTAREVVIGPPVALDVDRSREPAVVQAQLDARLRALAAGWAGAADGSATAVPTPAEPIRRWRLLSSLGRTDLTLARLAEGHLDALAILAEAGQRPQTAAVYGVWASASGGTGLAAARGTDGWTLDGLLRFCSGAPILDRALVTARDSADGLLLLDVDLHDEGITAVPGSWPAVGMDASASLDVRVAAVRLGEGDVVGGLGFYLERAGLPIGGLGVAAVWLGGAQGLLDSAIRHLSQRAPDEHQLAHLGAVAAALESAASTLLHIAESLRRSDVDPDTGLPAAPWEELGDKALLGRSAVEAAVAVALERLPRVVGPVVLCHDGDFAHQLADLTVYVRQHHAERDLARLGRLELAGAAVKRRV